jgi:protein gp37
MGEYSNIAWTLRTWNPWRGCTKVDPGCKNCYMFPAQLRGGLDPSTVVRTKTWGDPRKWQREAQAAGRFERVFTCSWSDWFHADADAWRPEAWALVKNCPNLHFQVLTKRADRIASCLPPDWGDGYPNVWLGVSISEEKGLWRADELRKILPRVRFISYEPALGPLGALNLTGIHWVIFGGESGPAFRPMNVEWARAMRDKCKAAGVAFFYKQSAARLPGQGHELDGQVIQEYPAL